MRKYKFDWSLIGNLEDGRAHLGQKVDLDVYRLLLFTMRDVLEDRLGTDTTDSIFSEAGKIAGTEFYKHFIHPVATVEEFVSKVQKVLREKNIGIMRVEETELDKGRVVLAIDEDLDCSGLPEVDYEVCIYDEGFVSALFESFTGTEWSAKEIDCWCTGARTCRFLVEAK